MFQQLFRIEKSVIEKTGRINFCRPVLHFSIAKMPFDGFVHLFPPLVLSEQYACKMNLNLSLRVIAVNVIIFLTSKL